MTPGRFITAALISLSAATAGVAAAGASASAAAVPTPAFRQVAESPYAAGPGATAVAFSPDGSLLAVADYSLGAVNVFAVAPGGRLHKVPGSPFPTGAGPLALAFNHSGRTLAIADFGASELTLDAVSAGGRLTPERGSPRALAGPPYDVVYSPDGRLIATADSTADAIQIIATNGDNGPLTATATDGLSTGSEPTSLAFSPDGALLAVAEHGSDAVAAYDLTGRDRLPTMTALAGSPFATPAAADTVSFNREGTLIAASDYNADQIDLLGVSPSTGLTAAAGGAIATGPGSGPDSAVFSPVSDRLAVAFGTTNLTGVYSVIPGLTPSPLTGSPLPAGTGPTALAFNSQGTLLATANIYSNSVSVYASTAPPPVVIRLEAPRARIHNATITLELVCAEVVDRAPGHTCSGRLTLTRAGKRLKTVRFRLDPGHMGRLTLRLPRTVVELTRRHRHLSLTETVSATGARSSSRTLTVSS